MKAISLAMVSTAAVLCLSAPSHAETFTYTNGSNGKLIKEGQTWSEYGAGKKIASFSELGRTDRIILLFDRSRLMVLRLPVASGGAFWTDLSGDSWSKLSDGNYEP